VRFIIFLSVFFSLYGGLHLYGFLKAKQALNFNIGATVALIIFMILMVLAPVLVRISEKSGFESIARLLAFIGYTWMGLLFFFVSVSLVLDFYRLLLYISRLLLQADLAGITPLPRDSFIFTLCLSIIITVYGAYEASVIRTERLIIKTPKIPAAIGSLKIVQISDVHLGLIVSENRLEKILKQVKAAGPDILVSTGDFVDGQMDNLSGLVKKLRDIHPQYGKFAITGNHEFYAGLDRALNFTGRAGFTILRGQGVTVSDILNIAGVDDTAGSSYGLMKQVSEKALLSTLPADNFTLLLKHRPLVDIDALGLFDLQLSGHTHKGQIFPFGFITRLYYPNHTGLLKLKKNAFLYVSRGTGTWGPPVRFLAPPEVTVIKLVHESRK
jgi:predicted MPP superfamily phosphohydrolase